MNTKRILHTWSAGLLVIGAMLLTLVGCMDDDLAKNNGDVVEGVPITVTMNLGGLPTADVTVETRASGDQWSDLAEIVICVFHENDGSLEQIVTNYQSNSLTVNSNTTDNNNRLYNVSFNTTSGTKKLIALANVADGAYWGNLITLVREAYEKNENFDVVKAKIATLNNELVAAAASPDGMRPFHIIDNAQMFISGWNESVIFGTDGTVIDYGTYGNGMATVAVKMNRAMAHITFKIAANPVEKQGTFTPTSYCVYNIPTKSYLTNDKQVENSDYTLTSDIDGVRYIHSASESINAANQEGYFLFDFYMPENIQKVAADVTINVYNDRDKWTGETGATATGKQWTNAPQNSTFVVISGTYEGKAEVDGVEQMVTANVEYTIHLGDFGASIDQNRDFTDFSVIRNNSYTYNVQVLGVNNIIVEAKKEGENQSGAEGSVYDREHTLYTYNLDAHYEQVYLLYDLSAIADAVKTAVGPYNSQTYSEEKTNKAIAEQLVLIIQSEAMDYTNEYSTEKPYTTRNKRGTLSPYQIYADAKAAGSNNVLDAKNNVLLDSEGTGIEPKGGFDYKWIEFYPQAVDAGISKYPGISSWAKESLEGMKNPRFYENADGKSYGANYLMDVYDIIVAMGNVVKKIYKGETISTAPYAEGGIKDVDFFTGKGITITQQDSKYYACFTAFVNEYYYLRHPLTGAKATSWSVVTNKMNREMIIAMSTNISTDGNSSYSKIHSYISQLPMQTFYNDRVSTINAFGIETYNETPLSYTSFSFYGNNGTHNTSQAVDSDLTSDNGRENQKELIGAANNPDWDQYIVYAHNGWTTSVGTDRTEHKLNDGAYNIKAAYSACMSRNRDLNGNGKIDENEIRWFLPSLNEYIRIGIGVNAISSAARLYMGQKSAMTHDNYMTKENAMNGAFYFTSSKSSERVFWAVEKGGYSGDGLYSANYYGGKPIRCIRVLPAAGEGATTDISSVSEVKSDATFILHENTQPMTLEFKDRLVTSLYRGRVQSLEIHNEEGVANAFYDGIYVAKDYLPRKYPFRQLIGYYQTSLNNPCSSYEEVDSDGNMIKNWRLPNLVELSAMNAAKDNNGESLLTKNPTSSCTQFSNLNVRYGFVFTTGIGCWGSSIGDIYNEIFVRCVRDVPVGYTFPTN